MSLIAKYDLQHIYVYSVVDQIVTFRYSPYQDLNILMEKGQACVATNICINNNTSISIMEQ